MMMMMMMMMMVVMMMMTMMIMMMMMMLMMMTMKMMMVHSWGKQTHLQLPIGLRRLVNIRGIRLNLCSPKRVFGRRHAYRPVPSHSK